MLFSKGEFIYRGVNIKPPLKVENPGNSPNLRLGVLIFSFFSAKFGLRGLNLGPFFGPLK